MMPGFSEFSMNLSKNKKEFGNDKPFGDLEIETQRQSSNTEMPIKDRKQQKIEEFDLNVQFDFSGLNQGSEERNSN